MSGAHGGYYLPDPTKWPIITSMGLFLLALGFTLQIHHLAPGPWLMVAGAIIIILMIAVWFGQVATESEAGRYDDQVDGSFRMGMGWFIFSEVMFFAAFFGALFYTRVLSVPWLGGEEMLWPGFEAAWPTAGPQGAAYIGPDAHEVAPGQFSSIGAFGVPLLNTVLLLSSSVTVTIAHWALKKNQRAKLNFWLFVTVVLGFCLFVFPGRRIHGSLYPSGPDAGIGCLRCNLLHADRLSWPARHDRRNYPDRDTDSLPARAFQS